MAFTGFYDVMMDLEKRFKNDQAVNKVSFGNLLDYDTEKASLAPCAHFIPGNFSFGANGAVFLDIQIFVYDIGGFDEAIPDELEDSTSRGDHTHQDSLDTCLAILERVLEPLNDRTVHLENSYYKLGGLPTFQAVVDRGNSLLTGWLGTVSLTFYSNAPKC